MIRAMTRAGRIAAIAVSALALLPVAAQAARGADTIYRDATVLTVDDQKPRAQAVAIRDGLIVGVGSDREILARWGQGARIVDLKGKTLVPGFVDGHSHIGDLVSLWRLPDLSPPPVGATRTIADVQRILGAALAKAAPAPGKVLLGVGYDDSLLAERRHPSKADLDAVSTSQPICIMHVSGHMARCNSAALTLIGVTRDTPDPVGGHLGRDAQGEPDGVIEENALAFVMKAAPIPTYAQAVQDFAEIQTYYAAQGYTTAQDGATSNAVTFQLLQDGQRDNSLILDIIAYPRWDVIDAAVAKRGLQIGAPFKNHLKFAGVKVIGDGSPQGKTAWLKEPYVHPPHGAPLDYRGFPNVPPADLAKLYDTYLGRGWQVQTHCNGDACIDSVIDALGKAEAAHPGAKDTRPVVIHSQVTRADQLQAYAKLGVFPSFFAEHTYYWGDWHRTETLGPDRAAFISPTAQALKDGVRFSLHSDAPVVPPVAMHVMWSAVNRVTRSGYPLGPDQRLTPMEALRAITLWPAWQQHEETTRGSITVGKQADLVVLEANPLTVEQMSIRNIKVLLTVKSGREIFRLGETPVARRPFAGEPVS
ncbi:amidohydrolase [Phenylobacterium sp.]|uniref:amidohydrolase n=1 Tax=Phenylobacterium sp. TaxID=1871053 RepID=UPI0035AED12E